MGILGWFAELGSELVSAEYNLGRDLHNVGGDPASLSEAQKTNLLLRYLTVEEIEDLTMEQVDSILRSALR